MAIDRLSPIGPATVAPARPQTARAAFFAQAAGKIDAAPTQLPATAPQPQTVDRTSEPAPDRPLRPGSLLDIRV